MLKKMILIMFLGFGILHAQNEISANINEDSYDVGIDAYLNDYYMLNDNSKYFFGVHLLGVDNQVNERKLWSADFKVTNHSANSRGFNFGLGLKSVLADTQTNDLSALSFGAVCRYEINDHLNLNASYYYAPKVLTFMDGKNFQELKTELNFEVVNNAFASVGYRVIKTEFENVASDNFDESVYAGLKFKF
mgnify:FL=1